MNTENMERSLPNLGAEVKLYSAKEMLRREARNIEVPENAELLLSPSHPELASYFAQIRLQSYEDLQLLGFVPRKLSEEKIRRAIAADDDEVYKIASAAPQVTHACECMNEVSLTRRSSFSSGLRTAYNAIRKAHNLALARLLSDHYNTSIPWDDPVPRIVRRWVSSLDARIYSGFGILIALTADITINRNATLKTDKSMKSLLANNIWIHRTGRLVQQGSYMKIWANSIRTFINISGVVTEATKRTPPWIEGLGLELGGTK